MKELQAIRADGRFRYLPPDGAGAPFVLYGLGPNKADERGTIVYDPTNGVSSVGDHVLTLSP